MLGLLALMTLCLCRLKADLIRVEAEIQAVEERAIERENHLLATRTVDTATDVPEIFIPDELAAPEAPEEPDQTMAPWPDEETEYILRVLTHEAGCDELLCGSFSFVCTVRKYSTPFGSPVTHRMPPFASVIRFLSSSTSVLTAFPFSNIRSPYRPLTVSSFSTRVKAGSPGASPFPAERAAIRNPPQELLA